MCEKSKSTTLSYYKIDQCWINSVCKTNKCSLEIITYLKYALDCLKKMGVQSLLRQCPNKHVFFNGGLPICALWLKMIETSHEYVPSNISFQCLNRHHCQNIHSQRQNSCFSHFLRVKHKLEKLSLNTHLCFCCCCLMQNCSVQTYAKCKISTVKVTTIVCMKMMMFSFSNLTNIKNIDFQQISHQSWGKIWKGIGWQNEPGIGFKWLKEVTFYESTLLCRFLCWRVPNKLKLVWGKPVKMDEFPENCEQPPPPTQPHFKKIAKRVDSELIKN